MTILLAPVAVAAHVMRYDEKNSSVQQWCMRTWARSLCWAGSVKVELHGAEHIVPGRGVVYASNHVSWFERDAYTSVESVDNGSAGSPNRLLYSPHTEISNPPNGPQSFSCGYTGSATWSTTTWGGDGAFTYTWIIDYDDSFPDDEYPTETSNTLTWSVDASKGSFTVSASVLTYIDSKQASLNVTVGPCSAFGVPERASRDNKPVLRRLMSNRLSLEIEVDYTYSDRGSDDYIP